MTWVISSLDLQARIQHCFAGDALAVSSSATDIYKTGRGIRLRPYATTPDIGSTLRSSVLGFYALPVQVKASTFVPGNTRRNIAVMVAAPAVWGTTKRALSREEMGLTTATRGPGIDTGAPVRRALHEASSSPSYISSRAVPRKLVAIILQNARERYADDCGVC